MSVPVAPSRKALKAALARSTPAGGEAAALVRAEAELRAAQEALRALREERSRNEREISVRERKIADWKGKIPFEGTPDARSAAAALARAGAMPCTVVADLSPSAPHAEAPGDERGEEEEQEDVNAESMAAGCEGALNLTFRPRFRRAMQGLRGFSHVWVVTKGARGVGAAVCEVIAVDARAGTVRLLCAPGARGIEGDAAVVDVKPYLAYCDALGEQN